MSPGEQRPKVSIIMTTYNAEEHLRESIDSALAQTLKEIEVVCIDGHSKDSTCDIIREYSARDPRVKLFFQDRPTIGAAKNCGIEWSTGEYFTFLDADDFYVDPTALEKMYYCAKRTGCHIIGAYRSTVFESDGKVIQEILHHEDCRGHPEGVKYKYRDRQYDYHFHSYIYDHDMIMDSDARFAEVTAYDDTHFTIRAMLLADDIYVIPVELYRYRCGPPYVFSQRQANDAMGTLTDQLMFTSEMKLARLHWLTVQRISWEYGGTLESNIRKGDIGLLSKLIYANQQIDNELVEQALSEDIPMSYYEPMIHRNMCDMQMRLNPNGEPKYLLEPLYRLIKEPDSASGCAVSETPKQSLPTRVRNHIAKIRARRK